MSKEDPKADEKKVTEPDTDPKNTDNPSNDLEKLFSDNQEVVKDLVKDSLKEELKTLDKPMSEEELQNHISDAIQKDRGNLAKLLTGETDQAKVNELTKALLTDTGGTLDAFADALQEQIMEQVEAKQAQRDERTNHVAQLRNERPDIFSSEENMSLFNRIFDGTKGDDLSARISEATNEFDLMLEKFTGKDKESRLKEIATVSSSSSGDGDSGLDQKSEQDIFKEEMAARQDRFNKTRNRTDAQEAA
jgi:hypothetical protein